ncbi:MAG: DUF2490 domain-containing protein [Ferruginibacter sp.]|nr:DUF2490 domain-containing protein [Cytophagales bacterium]
MTGTRIFWLGLALASALASSRRVFGQTGRVVDHNPIGWYIYNGDHSVSRRWEVHTEYQWRRIGFIRTWQQSLIRLGAAYQVLDKVKVAAGYTHFTTYPYGEHPVADQGAPTPEHRTHQDVQLADTVGRLVLSHRIRLEQRWLGQLAADDPRRVAGWAFQNRIRYQLQANFPLEGAGIDDQEFYFTCFDELFIGFGKNVGDNVYNQNRILGGIGYQFRDNFQVEVGYLNQITQHAEGDPVTGRPVFEINNGFRVTVNYGLDFTRQAPKR